MLRMIASYSMLLLLITNVAWAAPESTPTTAPESTPTPAPAKAIPKAECTLTDTLPAQSEQPLQKAEFNKNTDKIYLLCDSNDIQKGQRIRSIWIAANTNNVAPNNYKIDEKDLEITEDNPGNRTLSLKFALSKPTNGWPAGTYHVDIFVDNELIKSVPFSIK